MVLKEMQIVCHALIAKPIARMQGYQPDWEAILSDSPRPFIASLSRWLYPTAVAGFYAAAEESDNGSVLEQQPSVDNLPAVKELLDTMRARLEALNGVDAESVHGK